MAGAFVGDQLVEVVQMLGVNSKTGVLRVKTTKGSGTLAFRDGKVIAARNRDKTRGEEAVFEILGLASGDFEFRPELPAIVKTEHELSVAGLLLEQARRKDHESHPDLRIPDVGQGGTPDTEH